VGGLGCNRLDASEKPIRPVFLINSRTLLPSIVLAIQEARAGAIVSEDEVTDLVAVPPARVELWKGQYADVRWAELQYADGTSGFNVNRVLNKTGPEALAQAISMAKSGDWPVPPARSKTPPQRAAFIEKTYSTPYPDEGIRMVAAAQIWAVFSYFHPYKHLYDRDWDSDVLPEYLLKLSAARDAREYHMAVGEMVSHTKDTHCFVNSRDTRGRRHNYRSGRSWRRGHQSRRSTGSVAYRFHPRAHGPLYETIGNGEGSEFADSRRRRNTCTTQLDGR
jgi:hypothetical protein